MKFLLSSLSLLAMTPFVTSNLGLHKTTLLPKVLMFNSQEISENRNLRPLPSLNKHHKKPKKDKKQKEQQSQSQSSSKPKPKPKSCPTPTPTPIPTPTPTPVQTTCDLTKQIIFSQQITLNGQQFNNFLSLVDGKHRLIVTLLDAENKPVQGVTDFSFKLKWNQIPIALTAAGDHYEGYFYSVTGYLTSFKTPLNNGNLNLIPVSGLAQAPSYTKIDIKIAPICVTLTADIAPCRSVRNNMFKIGQVQQNIKCLPYWQTEGNVDLIYADKYFPESLPLQKVAVLQPQQKLIQRLNILPFKPNQQITYQSRIRYYIFIDPNNPFQNPEPKAFINKKQALSIVRKIYQPTPQLVMMELICTHARDAVSKDPSLLTQADMEVVFELVGVGRTVYVIGVNIDVLGSSQVFNSC